MSRIGKQPIAIPANVKVTLAGEKVSAEGPKGRLTIVLPPTTAAQMAGATLTITRQGDAAEAKAMHGLARALVNNMIQGVSLGYQRKLEIQGVGFKASVQSNQVNMALGFSHPIVYPIPSGIKVTVDENTKITIDGADKELVGRVASELRSYYPPEPYKGKGVRYAGEHVVRKEGKTVQ
ncbi:MAG: 50S ribosomal protein L6 [Verrucomicrobiota bacterium]|jgi:large subunit ribosomal protein L6